MLVLLLWVVSCVPEKEPVERASAGVEGEVLVSPETDNEHGWSVGSKVRVSTETYTLEVKMIDSMASHSETEASGSVYGWGSGGYGSYRMEQNGKGIMPVEVKSVSPDFHNVEVGDLIIIKVTDLKAMAIPTGAVFTVVCNEDVEVVSPNVSGQVLTTDRLTYELDDCRLKSPEFKLE
jgi:hypothetical protein